MKDHRMTPILLAAALVAAPSTQEPLHRKITVNGNAEIRVAPDIVQLLLAVETVDKSVMKAKQASDERVAKTISVATRFGVEQKDIQTDRISIDARSDSSSYSSRSETTGFVVRRSIVVTLRDVKKFEDLLTAVLEAGTNRIDGIDFQTSAIRKHRDAARAAALKAAREKATAMAGDLGMKVGKASDVIDGYGGVGMWGYGRRGNPMAQNVSQNEGPVGDSSEGFAPGQIAVTATVSVTFDLE